MSSDTLYHFIIIEDNHFDTRIAEKVVGSLRRSLSVKTFSNGYLALEYIEGKGVAQANGLTYILLDVYMPQMGGFEFLESYEKLPEDLRYQYRIIMLSSSINFADVVKAKDFPSVFATVEKPISEARLLATLDMQTQE